MTQLTDPRSHVFAEAPSEGDDCNDAATLGRLVRQLLDAYPDIDLPTIRLWKHSADGPLMLRVDARRGELAGVECPQCHSPLGRPHTEYCTLAPGTVGDGVLPSAPIDPAEDFVGQALAAADAGNAGHWPTVASYLADEIRRLDPARR